MAKVQLGDSTRFAAIQAPPSPGAVTRPVISLGLVGLLRGSFGVDHSGALRGRRRLGG